MALRHFGPLQGHLNTCHKLCPQGALLLPILVAVIVASAGCAGVIGRGSATTNAQPPALAITIGSLPSGIVQNAYSQSMSATGGTAPYSWSVISGSPPAGLSLSSAGQITGTPTQAGTSSFTAQVKDSSSPAQVATANLSITVAAAVAPLQVVTSSLAGVQVNTAYSATLSASGGTAPYNWSLSSGSLPAGLTLGSSGQISGTPTSAGTSPFVVKVTDSSSPVKSATASLSITVTVVAQPALRLNPTNVDFGNVVDGSTNSQAVQISNTGNTNLTVSQANVSGTGFKISGLTLPLSLNAGQASVFNVQFTPPSTGSMTGSVSFVSNAPNSPATLPLSGSGVAATATLTLSASPTSVSFGSVNLNTLVTQNVTVTNTGNSNVTISQITVSGTGFSMSGPGTPVTLSPAQKLVVVVGFDPLLAGSANGSLSVVSNASSSPNTVSLTGNGLSVGAPDLTPPNCGLTNDSTNHPPTGSTVTTINGSTTVSWHDFPANMPDVGGTWVDNLYGCTSKVLTNVITKGAGQVHNYAISPSMDRGDCYTLALDANAGLSSQYILASPTADCVGGIGAWGSTVIASGSMPARTSHNEFVWDYFTGGKFWFANANTIRNCTITGINTLSCATTHTFAEYSAAGCNFIDYSAMNQNGFIDVVCQSTSGGVMDIFVYDTVHDVKSPVYTTACTGSLLTSNQPGCIHKMAGPSPGNGILVQFTGNSCGNESGNHWFTYPTPVNPMPQVECRTDHVDVMRDLSANDVALFEDFQDNPGPWLGCANSFRPTLTKLPLSGNPDCMLDVPVEFGWDISTRDTGIRAWGLYSVQGSGGGIGAPESCNNSGSYADPTSGNWNGLANELVLARVDAVGSYSKIWRIGLTHERGKCGGNTFYSDPRAAISIDGKYVTYDTNARCGTGTCSSAVLTDIVVMGPLF
jgi:putative Ig domain-containing protein/centrosomal CEP192-like protein